MMLHFNLLYWKAVAALSLHITLMAPCNM